MLLIDRDRHMYINQLTSVTLPVNMPLIQVMYVQCCYILNTSTTDRDFNDGQKYCYQRIDQFNIASQYARIPWNVSDIMN